MIVSHEHRFIFIKTRKTAGSSVEVVLSQLAGPDAVVTTLMPPEEGHQPRNWRGLFNPLPELAARYVAKEPSLRSGRGRQTFDRLKHRVAFYNHMPAAMVRARLGKKTWDGYFKFCFERNPWDKTISRYFHLMAQQDETVDFEEWVRSTGLPSDWDLYSLRGQLAVDFVGRYDQLSDDLQKALAEVGIADPVELPHAKAQHRPAGARPQITPAVDRRIRESYAREIEAFGFEPPAAR